MPVLFGPGRAGSGEEAATCGDVTTRQAGLQLPDCDPREVQGGLGVDNYSVRLTTLYDSNLRQSYIVNEVAMALALRYVQVPSRIVYTSSTTLGKTNKLFILDVKPRSTAADAGPLLLTAYGLDKVDLTLPEESKLDMLRSKFEIRPGHLSNTGVAQPVAPAHLVIVEGQSPPHA